MSAIDLLLKQHQEVEALFQRVMGLQGEERIELLGRIAEALTLHAALEEQYFYPLLREHGLEDDASRSYEDHAEVRALVSELLKAKQTDPRLNELLTRLVQSVRQHVDTEERMIIPRALSSIDQARVNEVGRDMQEAIAKLRQQELLKMAEHQERPAL